MPHPMTAEHLHVFTARSNPLGWKTPHRNWEAFAKHMLDSGVHLHVVECAYGEEPFSCEYPSTVQDHENLHRFHHYGVRATTRAWVKENLLNLGIQRAPEARLIAWIDADVFFRDIGESPSGALHDPSSNWASKTVRALQHYSVVQPWSDALDLGPNDEIIAHHKSFLSQWYKGQPVIPQSPKWWHSDGGPYTYPHSGYAWAMTRQAFDSVGQLFEQGGMGSGDHTMALALVGHADYAMPLGTSESYRTLVKLWEQRAIQHVNYNLGYVQGNLEHRFHGSKVNRGYQSRWEMFVTHAFCPIQDLKRNAYGVLELAQNKPALRHAWNQYLRARNEDSNSL